jgi:4-methyl-5(b-hydroxyethyl)-thiazole monophosphate biosynthesis
MSKSALLLLANGFEEIEATCPIDLLRRAETNVSVASCENSLWVTGRSNIKLEADCLFDGEISKDHDMLVLPGGPAVFELRKNPQVLSLIRDFDQVGKPIGAICAAPLLLLDAEIIRGRRHTAHGSVSNELPDIQNEQLVVHDENLITSRGAGTAVEFGLRLVEILYGEEKANEIRHSIHADFTPADEGAK